MPRRNLHILVIVMVVSFICYHRADSKHRNHYGAMFETFVTTLGQIKDRCLYEVGERKLFEGAMEGLVREIEDPYSAYQGEAKTREFYEQLDQEFGGIGVEITIDRETKQLKVMSPIVGSPAYEMGMMAGDLILKINDKETKGFTTEDGKDLLRGKPGDPVKLTVLHRGDSEPVEIEIKRAIISVASVLGDRHLPDGSWDFTLEADPSIGYIRISHFGEKTVDELKKALEQCRAKNVRGLTLDLRDNPGGLLTAANDVCDLFIKQGMIVEIRERGNRVRERYEATGSAPYPDLPMAVLVNGDSASASEIVAACLQDHNRAVIVGTRTYGKGTVQTPVVLEGGRSMLRLTIASYWRPSGRNINRKPKAKEDEVWGVDPSPQFEVKLDDKAELAKFTYRRERDVVHRPGEKPAPKPSATPTATPSATPTATPSATPSASPTATPSATKPDAKPTGTSTESKPKPDTPLTPPERKPEDGDETANKEVDPNVITAEQAAKSINLDPQLQKALDYLKGMTAKPEAKRAA